MQPTTVSPLHINSHYADSVYNWIDKQIILGVRIHSVCLMHISMTFELTRVD